MRKSECSVLPTDPERYGYVRLDLVYPLKKHLIKKKKKKKKKSRQTATDTTQ
jgi:hypothetical protein